MYITQGGIFEGYHRKIYDEFSERYTSVNSSSPSIIEEYLKKHSIDLMLPHPELKQYLLCYEKDQFSPLTKDFVKYVEKMQQLFMKIKASESDSPTWFNLLKEANDPEYLKQNVENFLLKNLSNQKLWKIYINYLKEIDPKEMLQVYSKYCRCFLEDEEMKEKYKNEMEIYGPIFVKWKNAFDFENVAERVPSPTAKEYIMSSKNIRSKKRKLEEDEKPPKFVCPKVDLNKIFSQDWSLPKPIIRYIASQTHPPTSEKLLQSCKYFFKHNSVLYCYKASSLYVHGNYDIKENSFLISISSFNSPPFNKKNIYISNVLIFHGVNSKFLNIPCNATLSEAIKNSIFQCDAKFIDIKNQNLSEKEFQFLVGHGNVKYLVLDDIHIFENSENNDEMALEEIFKMTPKLEYVSILLSILR
uniref:Uncharacterized protein n=1 Tax=Panagrolaimus davidi TaxID=227884 RepID=A0A914PB13_9BILA